MNNRASGSFTDILFVIAPPFWEYLPPLSLGYLKGNIESFYSSFLYDLNILAYNYIKPKIIWGSDKSYNKKLFNLVLKKYPILIDDFFNTIQEKNPKIIGFSIYRSNFHFSFSLARFIKKNFPYIKLIAGGPEIFEIFSLNSKKLNKKFLNTFDFFISGDGEEVINEVISKIKRNESLDKIIYSTNRINFNKYKFADFSDLDLTLYKKKGFLPIQSSRGCINNCSFCSEKFLSAFFRSKTPDRLIEEIKFYKKEYSVKNFVFYDSLINGNLDYIEKFCDSVIKENLDIHWEAQFLIRKDISFRLLEKMKKSGCYNLFIGLESASDYVLEKMNKNFTSDDAKRIFTLLNKAGLHFEISLIVDFPYEKDKDFWQTYNFIKNNKNIIPKIAQVNRWLPYPGTDLKKRFYLFKKDKVNILINMFRKEKIRYTPAYIKNLYL